MWAKCYETFYRRNLQVFVTGNASEGEGLVSTVDLLIKVACFVKKQNRS